MLKNTVSITTCAMLLRDFKPALLVVPRLWSLMPLVNSTLLVSGVLSIYTDEHNTKNYGRNGIHTALDYTTAP